VKKSFAKPAARQRGVALLTAMLVVTLVTIIGAGMLSHMNLAAHRSGNLWLSEQAWWYAVGVEGWAGQILARDARANKIDSLDQAWAQPVDYLPIEGGAIQGRLLDLQGRFNLNNLVGPGTEAATLRFQRLIELTAEVDVVAARRIAQATRDWIDADVAPTLPDGAEDGFYLGLQPAYRTGNRPFASPSELRAVRGVTGSIYAALAPHIAALPAGTAINVNTATTPVLASLHEGIGSAVAEDLAERRREQPWSDVQTFLQESELADLDIDARDLSVASAYFLASGHVTVERAQLTFHSVLQRADDGRVRVLRHSRDVR
jgi:general secretion pathway protein K